MEGVGGESGAEIAHLRLKSMRKRHVAQKEGKYLMLKAGDGAKQSGITKVEWGKIRPGRQKDE